MHCAKVLLLRLLQYLLLFLLLTSYLLPSCFLAGESCQRTGNPRGSPMCWRLLLRLLRLPLRIIVFLLRLLLFIQLTHLFYRGRLTRILRDSSRTQMLCSHIHPDRNAKGLDGCFFRHRRRPRRRFGLLTAGCSAWIKMVQNSFPQCLQALPKSPKDGSKRLRALQRALPRKKSHGGDQRTMDRRMR